jgi:hypothetical protein
MRIKAFIFGLLAIFGAGIAGVGVAQDAPPQAQTPVNPEVKLSAQNLIEKGLQLTHAAEIFADLRRTLAEVYIPVMRELVQGGYPGAPEADAATAAQLAKMLTFMDYLRKGGDELDVALSENRSAMISDAAGQMAKTLNLSEISDVQRMFELPAVRKSLDAFYAISKLVTGFTYEDSRTFAEFSAWANSLKLDLPQAVAGTLGNPKTVPSAKKVMKAQALMDDLLKLSHLDEMVSQVQRFAKEVYVETAPMSDEDREEMRGKIIQFEFMYNMQKAVVIGVAPSAVAAALSDEQLATLHGYLLSPAFAKAFDLLRNAVRAVTAYTKEDILQVRAAVEDLDRKAKLGERSAEEREQMQQEWQALIDKWTETLKNSISPETRRGFDQSLEDLQLRNPPI